MTRKLILLAAMAAGASLLWCTRAPDHGKPESGESAAVLLDDADHEAGKPESAGTRPPPTPVSARPSRPGLAVERVDFDRRPWDPDNELEEVYLERVHLAEAFDRFVAEAGISDRRARQILMILYDYQENKRFISEELHRGSPYRNNLEFERRLAEATELRYITGVDNRERLDAMLSPEETRVWRRVVRPTNIWLMLTIAPRIGPAARE